MVQDAIHDARFMCVRTHGDAPEVIFHSTANLDFPSVPSYASFESLFPLPHNLHSYFPFSSYFIFDFDLRQIYYIIFELMKNSMRAVTEKHGENIEGNFYLFFFYYSFSLLIYIRLLFYISSLFLKYHHRFAHVFLQQQSCTTDSSCGSRFQ